MEEVSGLRTTSRWRKRLRSPKHREQRRRATRSLRDISYQLQSAISIASHPKAGADDAFVVQAGRLGLALVFGYASALSSAVDGVALIADDEVEWWWSTQIVLPFVKKDRHGVVRVLTTVPTA
jgi:hypothetical protein